MFGALTKAAAALAAMAMDGMDPAPEPWFFPKGPQPRKFRPHYGPPANYPDGPAGDVARRRAIRRFERWQASNPDRKPPMHIIHNFAQATNYEPA